MQIVIEIPDGYVKVIMANQRTEGSAMDKLIRQAVIDGTPLPKGHGRLGDLDALKENMENGIRAGLLEEGYERYTNILDMDDCVECVEFADTIIEADREERDADSN